MGDFWPGRVETGIQRDRILRDNYFGILQNAQQDEAIFLLESKPEWTDLTQKYFGPRCAVWPLFEDIRHGYRRFFIGGLSRGPSGGSGGGPIRQAYLQLISPLNFLNR